MSEVSKDIIRQKALVEEENDVQGLEQKTDLQNNSVFREHNDRADTIRTN